MCLESSGPWSDRVQPGRRKPCLPMWSPWLSAPSDQLLPALLFTYCVTSAVNLALPMSPNFLPPNLESFHSLHKARKPWLSQVLSSGVENDSSSLAGKEYNRCHPSVHLEVLARGPRDSPKIESFQDKPLPLLKMPDNIIHGLDPRKRLHCI